VKKYLFIVPLLSNEGQPFPASDWDWLQDELVSRFGGWTLDGKVEGAWRDAESGQIFRDSSLRYVVVVEENAVSDLLAFLGEVKVRFSQLALYVERPQTEVIFL
jgi:hypothetical protein